MQSGKMSYLLINLALLGGLIAIALVVFAVWTSKVIALAQLGWLMAMISVIFVPFSLMKMERHLINSTSKNNIHILLKWYFLYFIIFNVFKYYLS